MSTLADRVREAMADLGINQTEAATRIGVKPQAVNQVLSGETKSLRDPLAWATALGVNVAWLGRGTGAKRNETSRNPEQNMNPLEEGEHDVPRKLWSRNVEDLAAKMGGIDELIKEAYDIKEAQAGKPRPIAGRQRAK